LYDVYQLTKAGISENAIHDQELYETIVAHRYKFSRVGGVDYHGHDPLTLNPTPIAAVTDVWKDDYNRMVEEMIYEQNAPTFEQLIGNLEVLKDQLKAVAWTYSLTFPTPNS